MTEFIAKFPGDALCPMASIRLNSRTAPRPRHVGYQIFMRISSAHISFGDVTPLITELSNSNNTERVLDSCGVFFVLAIFLLLYHDYFTKEETFGIKEN